MVTNDDTFDTILLPISVCAVTENCGLAVHASFPEPLNHGGGGILRMEWEMEKDSSWVPLAVGGETCVLLGLGDSVLE